MSFQRSSTDEIFVVSDKVDRVPAGEVSTYGLSVKKRRDRVESGDVAKNAPDGKRRLIPIGQVFNLPRPRIFPGSVRSG